MSNTTNLAVTIFGGAAVAALVAVLAAGAPAGGERNEPTAAPARQAAAVRRTEPPRDDSAGEEFAAATAAAEAYARREPPAELRYDVEYPTVGYATTPLTDPVAKLQQRIARGEVRLEYAEPRGYLDSLLAALDIDPASQILVFSQTSLQSRRIRPSTPRAIYFNDDVYVAWVQGGSLEIGSMDPRLGPVFYTVAQNPDARPSFGRELTRCLMCHDSYSLTGGGVPRFLTGSGYTGTGGVLVAHEGWILVTDRTPLKSRWGGWYVTGRHGDQMHLGNVVIRSYSDFERLDELRIGNLDTLDGRFDTSRYLTSKSDIVALLVFEHQTNMQNAITRVNYDARNLLLAREQGDAVAAQAKFDESVEELVRRATFAGAIEYTSKIEGDPKFVQQFMRRAVRDPAGRSLRDLDLERRLFRYPLSYVLQSEAFAALPTIAKEAVYARLAQVLRGEGGEEYAHLSAVDLAAVREIATATMPELAAAL
jgi:hypothetical protein